MLSLLIDFGASRIKSAIYDTTDDSLNFIKSTNAVEPVFYEDKRCEVSAQKLKEKFIEILEDYYAHVEFEAVFLCTEMHGFILLDKNNEPLTKYISWRDERSLNIVKGMPAFHRFSTFFSDRYEFSRKTGLNLIPSIPVINIFSMLEDEVIKEDFKVISLSEWLTSISDTIKDNYVPYIHNTLRAGLGFHSIVGREEIVSVIYNVFSNCQPSKKLKGIFSFCKKEIKKVTYWNKIPIYTAVGDFQCAVLGADNTSNTISINLGTGSQIAVIEDEYNYVENDFLEWRPYFNNKYLKCITHIPSGRALNEYVEFLQSLTNKNVWGMLKVIHLDEINNSTLKFDLAIFNSAVNQSGFKGISNITEGSLTLRNYLASLLKSYANQYIELLKEFGDLSKYEKIILSGGISRKLPVLQEYFEQELKMKVEIFVGEETLYGLAKLAQGVIKNKTLQK